MSIQNPARIVVEIFISYSSTDAKFVDWLSSKLKASFYKPFTFHKDNNPGDHWVRNLENALETSDASILVLSSSFISSKWCRDELELLKIRENKVEGFIIIPVLIEELKDDKIPGLIKGITRIDFTDNGNHSREIAYNNLLHILERLPTSSNPLPDRKGLSLQKLFVSILVCSLLFIIGWRASTWSQWREWHRFQQVLEIQKEAQYIDDRVEAYIADGTFKNSSNDKEAVKQVDYVDPETNKLLAKDIFYDGQHTTRWLYKDDRIIAVDDYEFSGVVGVKENRKIIKKIRAHRDENGKVIVIDSFDYTKGGLNTKLDKFSDEMAETTRIFELPKSPPPQVAFLFYMTSPYR